MSFSVRSVAAAAGLGLVAALVVTGPATADERVPLASAAVPAGSHRDGAATGQVEVAVSLKPYDEAGLSAFVAAVSDPKSPLYRHYLSTAEYNARYAPRQSEVDKVAQYLRGKGLQVTSVSGNRQVVDAAGSPDQVKAAFGTSISDYTAPDGNKFYANDSAPSVPSTLAVRGVAGLTNRPVAHRASGPAGPAGPAGGYTPAQFRTAYGMTGLSGSYTGSGQTVGLIEFDAFKQSDIDAWTSYFKQPAVKPKVVAVDGGKPGPGNDQLEVTLDVQAVAATAPGAAQIVYEAPNSDKAWVDEMARIASDNEITILSGSWLNGEKCESAPIQSSHDSYSQMAAQGVTMLSASGDWGATGCGYQGDNSTRQADYPPSDPLFTGVGGTQLRTSDSAGTYQSESCWNQGSSGNTRSGGEYSQIFPKPDWQPGTNQYRSVPDVALDADYGAGALSVYMNGGWLDVGGTSLSSPLWAGYVAMVNQKAKAGGKGNVGAMNPTIYAAAQSAQYGSLFHDVTSGNNGTYSAGTGYDLCTGWGSPKGDALADTLIGGGGPVPPNDFSVTADPASATVTAGQSARTTVRTSASTGAHPSVVGGQPTTVDQYPFMISMRREGSVFPGKQSCSMALVNPHTVVGAAHCLLEKDGEKWFVYGATNLNDAGFRANIKESWTDPNYTSWQQGNDVAVITLDRDVPVPAGIVYPTIATDLSVNTPGTMGRGIGWGKTGQNTYSDVLRTVEFPVASDQACASHVDTNLYYKSDGSMLCTGYADGHAGVCVGDSGSPFLEGNQIVGFFSWMSNACNTYGVYSRVTTYADEIKAHIGGSTPTGDIALSASGLPTGASASFDPSSVNAGGSSSLTIATSASTPAGTYQVTITGKKGSTSHNATFTLTVQGGGGSPVSVQDPGFQFTQHGTPVNLQLRATGGSGSYRWSATGLPPGLTINPTTGLITGTPSGNTLYQVTATATDGGTTENVKFSWFVY